MLASSKYKNFSLCHKIRKKQCFLIQPKTYKTKHKQITKHQMPKESTTPAPTQRLSGRGSLGGGLNASAVDTDKLWRDRIQQELQFQRQWKDEFNSSVSNPNSARGLGMKLKLGESTNNNNNNNTSSNENSNNNTTSSSSPGDEQCSPVSARSARSSAEVVESLLQSTKNQSVGSTTASFDISEIEPQDLASLQKQLQHAQYTSTARASYKFDRSRLLELSAGSHRRQKFR